MMPNLTFVLGGAASGKSALAERLAEGTRHQLVYIATAECGDAEMRDKIRRHRERRGDRWTTIEETVALAAVISWRRADEIILVECLTMWVMNLMTAGTKIETEAEKLMAAIDSSPCPVILVSGETGMGIVPENERARRFNAALGTLNQMVASRADLALLAVAGLPVTLKGKAPPWI